MIKTYAHHAPSAYGLEAIRCIREAFSELHEKIEAACPASRERSVALTELETSAMWAIKSIVLNDPDSEITK